MGMRVEHEQAARPRRSIARVQKNFCHEGAFFGVVTREGMRSRRAQASGQRKLSTLFTRHASWQNTFSTVGLAVTTTPDGRPALPLRGLKPLV